MNVWLNDQLITCPVNASLTQLLATIDRDLRTSALAVNNQIVPRSQWPRYILQHDDQIQLFQLIAGG